MSINTDDAIDWVTKLMPNASAAAIAQFTTRNPHYRGAGWDDVLAIILDSDAQLVWTEPLHDVDESFPADVLESVVTVTLAWSSQAFVEELTDAEQIAAVRTVIEHEGEQQP